jgi:hypothetical protein
MKTFQQIMEWTQNKGQMDRQAKAIPIIPSLLHGKALYCHLSKKTGFYTLYV